MRCPSVDAHLNVSKVTLPIKPLAMAVDQNYLYVSGSGATLRLNKTTLATIDNVTVSGNNLKLDGGFMYITASNIVYKINLTTYSQVANLSLSHSAGHTSVIAGNFLYVTHSQSGGYLDKINLTDFTLTSTLSVVSAEARGCDADDTNSTLCVAYGGPANGVAKVDLTTFTTNATVSTTYSPVEVIVVGDFAYEFGWGWSGVKINITSWSVVSEISCSGSNVPGRLAESDGYIFRTTSPSDGGHLNRISITPFADMGSALLVTEATTSRGIRALCVDDQYFYCGAYDLQILYKVSKIQRINLAIKDASGNAVLANVTANMVLSNGTQLSADSCNGFVNVTNLSLDITNATISIIFQDIPVNTSQETTWKYPDYTNVSCNIYALSVKVVNVGNEPIPNMPLELYRNGTLLNGLYGLALSPMTNESGMFTWQQLAYQTGSYEVVIPGVISQTTMLTQDTTITITLLPPTKPPTRPTPPAPHEVIVTRWTEMPPEQRLAVGISGICLIGLIVWLIRKKLH